MCWKLHKTSLDTRSQGNFFILITYYILCLPVSGKKVVVPDLVLHLQHFFRANKNLGFTAYMIPITDFTIHQHPVNQLRHQATCRRHNFWDMCQHIIRAHCLLKSGWPLVRFTADLGGRPNGESLN